MKETFNFFEKNRRGLTALSMLVFLAFALVSHHSWPEGGPADTAFEWGGALLVVLGVLGRLWATAYIGGRKNQSLVTDGPYSLCRNPLYFFSFTAGLGICVVFENLVLIGCYIILFPMYYKSVIASEEKRLDSLFGAEFLKYKQRVPAFFPRLTRLSLGKLPEFSRALLWKNFLDGSVFLLFIPIAYLVKRLQESGIIHVYWNIP